MFYADITTETHLYRSYPAEYGDPRVGIIALSLNFLTSIGGSLETEEVSSVAFFFMFCALSDGSEGRFLFSPLVKVISRISVQTSVHWQGLAICRLEFGAVKIQLKIGTSIKERMIFF